MEPDFVLTREDVTALGHGRVVVSPDDAVFHLTGPGTIACLQGVLTNDLIKCGPQALIWGALLTPKGMIITDLWVRRDGDAAWLIVPRTARNQVAALLTRSFPPRLTKVIDRTDDITVRLLMAPAATDLSHIPQAILPQDSAPFSALIICDGAAQAAAMDEQLSGDGWRPVPLDFYAARKVQLAWPTLGREIDEKTLVQEVRFDELHGVKYDKGCYTGQETVARLHFRGHANRELQPWVLASPPREPELREGEKVIGRLTSWGLLGEEIAALALVRKAR